MDKQDLFLVFVDLGNADEKVNRGKLLSNLYGLYLGYWACLGMEREVGGYFEVKDTLGQSWMMSPCLFEYGCIGGGWKNVGEVTGMRNRINK